MMKTPIAIMLCLITIISYSCGSTYKLSNMSSKPVLSNTEINNLFVLVLYPDDEIEARVALEKSTSDHLNSLGIKAIAGYTKVPSYDMLERNPQEIIQAMKVTGSKNLLIFNPLKYSKYNDSEYYDAAMTYRALGMETSEFLNNVTALIESSDASKFVYGVSLWSLHAQDFLWEGTYDIKAPGAYDLDASKAYSISFVDHVLADIKRSK